MIFQGIREGWKLFTDSIRLLGKKPVFIVPISFAWILLFLLFIYMRYFFIPPAGLGYLLLIIFLIIFLMTMIICIANLMMLELMQQVESGAKISFFKAVKETFSIDLLKVIPVALIWAIIWFIILIIKALTSKKKEREKSKPQPSAKDMALTLGGTNSGPFSWLKLGLDMFEKLLRMYIFLTLPAIAWENKGPFSAFKRSLEVIKTHPMQFITSYSLTMIATLFMVIPIAIISIISENGANFPPIFWGAVIVYEGIVWTFSIYLEQMSVALLYLWHIKWVKNGSSGDLSNVPKPDLLDNVDELK